MGVCHLTLYKEQQHLGDAQKRVAFTNLME